MSKELIERLRDCGTFSAEGGEGLMLDAADALEQQQSWIASLEQNARDADRMYKELETELAEQQKRIDELIAELNAERDRRWEGNRESSDELAEAYKETLRLIETIKYLRGIAEKGEGREQREDETVEQFVLGYVKALEFSWAGCSQQLKDACEDLDEVEKQLVASQAQIKVLREALEHFALIDLGRSTVPDSFAFDVLNARKALAQPTDDSALRELLKAERERCAQLCDSIADADPYETNGYGCAAKIRAMEDQ